MNRDELVERVHSAIRAKLNHTPYMAPPDVLDECARAALAIIEPAVREAETQRCLAAFSEGWAMPLTATGVEAITLIRNTIRAGAKP